MKKIQKDFLLANYRCKRRDLSFDKLVTSIGPFFERVDTPFSLGLWLCLKYGDYKSFLTAPLDPNNYLDPEVFKHDYQCHKLLSKYPDFPRIFDTKKEAMQAFIDAEIACKETNDFFIDSPLGSLGGAVTQIVLSAKRK
jgi:hypothetical protein